MGHSLSILSIFLLLASLFPSLALQMKEHESSEWGKLEFSC